MDSLSVYRSKLTTAEEAVATIPSGSCLSMGMAMAEPPALLKALADRAEASKVENLRLYYFESTRIAGADDPPLRVERTHPTLLHVHLRD